MLVGLACLLLAAGGCADDAAAPGSATTPTLGHEHVEVLSGRTGLRFVLEGKGGVPPYSFTAPAEVMPPGLSIEPDGVVHGVPRVVGTFEFPVRITDARGVPGVQTFTLTITRVVTQPRPIDPDTEFPDLLSQNSLTSTQSAWLNGSGPLAHMQAWAAGEGLEVRADEAVLLIYDTAPRMVSIPVYDAQSGEQSWGAVFVVNPFKAAAEGMAYRVFPSTVSPMIRWYNGSGDSFTDHFDGNGDWVGTTFPKMKITIAGDDGDTWERIKEWFASDSPAEDLPWWYDFLCGLSCGAALSGNPLAISGCVHCIGGYIAACVPVSAVISTREPVMLEH